MTHLSAAAIMINALDETVSSTNPERDMALGISAKVRSGGLWSWLRGSRIGRTLAARKAERDLNIAILRLADLSPHLLADIGVVETTAPVAARADEAQISLAPVEQRAERQTARAARTPAKARVTTRTPVRALRQDLAAAQ